MAKEKENAIDCGTIEWVEAELKGNSQCPDCGETMILIPAVYRGVAYCPICEKHWIERKKDWASFELIQTPHPIYGN